jgi:hypothetical protein
MKRSLLLAALAVSLGACGDDDPTTTAGDDTASAATGTIFVHLEEASGIFIEGFEVGLRFETTSGEVIDATLWTDFVQSQSGDGAAIEAYYDSVLEQEVPAGPVVVLASVAIGMGPGPVAPDLDGDLDCRLEVDVPADGRVEIEVAFDSSTGRCLTEV